MMFEKSQPKHMGRRILAGLILGIGCGLFFGDYCRPLQSLGKVYVGLLQMTVLPYLMCSLVAKLGRLNLQETRRIGLATLIVMVLLWGVGIVLIVAMSAVLPTVKGASFFTPASELAVQVAPDFLARFIPTNVFYSLSQELVPAVVLFCLFFGASLSVVPRKEPLLDLLETCCQGIGRINMFLVRLAPAGLFALTAAAAGTLQIEELSRLQAYLIMFSLACVIAALGILPMLISSVTSLRYRDVLIAAQEPLYTVIATGKLFVVLPQIITKCDDLLRKLPESPTWHESGKTKSIPSVIVPLAYPFPHLGKILPFVFVSFAAWYSGRGLTAGETTLMAASGTVSSFASPLVTIPYLLDQFHLPQDLMPLFILPGFVTMRLGDVVGVFHLMALTLIVGQILCGRLQIQWRRLIVSTVALTACLVVAGGASRYYLASTTLKYDLDDRLMSLEIVAPHNQVVVYRDRSEVPQAPRFEGSTLQRVSREKVLRVGFPPNHLPYCYLNKEQQLVGLDVELMHRLAARLQVRLEFIPTENHTVAEQLNTGEIDLAIGGLMMKPERLLWMGFTEPYQTATMAVVIHDHRRGEFNSWNDPRKTIDARLGVVYEDVAVATRRELPNLKVEVIDSCSSFFEGQHPELDGLIIAAEEGAAWNVLYPEYSVVIPRPVVQRPVGIAVRLFDPDWLQFLNRWLDFERLDGSIERLTIYWIEGGGTQKQSRRWSVIQDVLQWVP